MIDQLSCAQLNVLVVEDDRDGGAGLSVVYSFLEECRKQFAFNLTRFPLHHLTDSDFGPISRPALVFVQTGSGVSKASEDLSLGRVLQVLNTTGPHDNHSLSGLLQVFVVSTREEFDAEEAQRIWLDHHFIVGYQRQAVAKQTTRSDSDSSLTGMNGLRLEDIRQVVERAVALVTANVAKSSDRKPVGRKLRMSHGLESPRTRSNVVAEYQKHRFASFLVGGMDAFLMDLRKAMEAIRIHAPHPRFDHDDLKFLIRNGSTGELTEIEDPFVWDANRTFDEIAQGVYGVGIENQRGVAKLKAVAFPERFQRLYDAWTPPQIPPHVLIQGDTGTGKTLLARWLHRARFDYEHCEAKHRSRIDARFQDLNCGALPARLLEPELFGGIIGSWTGLNRNTPGAIFCSCLGTLFLDEIGELPLDTQGVLLKYLDTFSYYPVGGHNEPLRVPTVVIAATNRNLENMVTQGRFRRDLLERFRFRIGVPNLKDRCNYMAELTDFVLQNPEVNPITSVEGDHVTFAIRYVHKRTLQKLREHDWPGNFRELEQVLWRAVLTSISEGNDTLMPHHVSFS